MADPRAWPPPLDDERAAQIRALVLDAIAAPDRQRRHRPLTVAVAAVAVLLAGAGTATALLRYAEPDRPNLGYCSPTATTDRSAWQDHAFGAVQAPDGTWETLQAIDACAAMRTAGILGADFQNGPGPERLTACVIDGELVVVPGGPGTCRRLGVPEAQPAP
ncbi:MAG: hypothetical protein LCI03_18910 [Actinobacteria bacterium]|nr:hypothetical protein [Actinomycetota bacterium]